MLFLLNNFCNQILQSVIVIFKFISAKNGNNPLRSKAVVRNPCFVIFNSFPLSTDAAILINYHKCCGREPCKFAIYFTDNFNFTCETSFAGIVRSTRILDASLFLIDGLVSRTRFAFFPTNLYLGVETA